MYDTYAPLDFLCLLRYSDSCVTLTRSILKWEDQERQLEGADTWKKVCYSSSYEVRYRTLWRHMSLDTHSSPDSCHRPHDLRPKEEQLQQQLLTFPSEREDTLFHFESNWRTCAFNRSSHFRTVTSVASLFVDIHVFIIQEVSDLYMIHQLVCLGICHNFYNFLNLRLVISLVRLPSFVSRIWRKKENNGYFCRTSSSTERVSSFPSTRSATTDKETTRKTFNENILTRTRNFVYSWTKKSLESCFLFIGKKLRKRK